MHQRVNPDLTGRLVVVGGGRRTHAASLSPSFPPRREHNKRGMHAQDRDLALLDAAYAFASTFRQPQDFPLLLSFTFVISKLTAGCVERAL